MGKWTWGILLLVKTSYHDQIVVLLLLLRCSVLHHRTIAEIRPRYGFDVSCPDSVPEAIIAFLEGNSFEEVIRLAISLGDDSDTIGAMAGAIAACVYPIPDEIAERCNKLLTEDLREIKDKFITMIEQRAV